MQIAQVSLDRWTLGAGFVFFRLSREQPVVKHVLPRTQSQQAEGEEGTGREHTVQEQRIICIVNLGARASGVLCEREDE